MPKQQEYNVLTDPIFRVSWDSKRTALTLPGVLSRLSSGKRIDSFEGLRPHQRQPWFCFLVQLSVLALTKNTLFVPPKKTDEWTHLLRSLTSSFPDDEPWSLVVEDPNKPGFFQSPCMEMPNKCSELLSPDELDILVTSKNHDIKNSTMKRAQPEHWIYSLITTQTLHGYPGRGYYGISRMNGGYGNRSFVSYLPSCLWHEQYLSSVATLIENREQLREKHDYYDFNSGLSLLWLEPWDGKKSLELQKLDPYFLEVCRRVRLILKDEKISALLATTDVPRVNAGDSNGNVGDPWGPVKSDGTLLTVKNGFDYRLTREFIFGTDYSSMSLNNRPESDGELVLLTRTTVRGQGKTEGHFERVITLPKNVRKMFSMNADHTRRLGEISKQWVGDVDELRKRCLKPALLQLSQGAPEKLSFKDERINDFVALFQRRVDNDFFPRLWDAVNLDEETARKKWLEFLKSEAHQILEQAKEALPLPSSRKYKAIAFADSFFYGSFYKNFPLMREEKGGEEVNA